MESYKFTGAATMPAPRGPHHGGPGGFGPGPHHHRPPHVEILEALEYISAQIAAETAAINERLDRLEAQLAAK